MKIQNSPFTYSTNIVEKTLKPKSTLFEELTKKITDYCSNRNISNYEIVTSILSKWKLSKKNEELNRNWTDSCRNHYIRELDEWLLNEGYLLNVFPIPEKNYNEQHNCYAYAMKCTQPKGLGANSTPGLLAGTVAKSDNFTEDVILDGKFQGKKVKIIGRNADPIPTSVSHGHYLVAIFSNQYGFHFMRRDEITSLWSHKNGAFSQIETTFYDTEQEKILAINNAVFKNIASNPKLMGCDMHFEAYIEIPDNGLSVSGITRM